MFKALPTCIAVVLVATAAWAQVPAGAEFQVNSYTTNNQYPPAVAADANGNFVVVWDGQDGNLGGVFGQRLSAAGLPLGAEFRINTHTTDSQAFSAVASDANGNFVVVWHSRTDGSDYGIFGQRFNASGSPVGSEFQANTTTASAQRFPAVASAANGNFVVVWVSYPDGNRQGVFGQRFSASGAPQSSEFRVNTYTTEDQLLPAVSSDANGNFVVVWQSLGQDGSYDGVFGQRFHAFGLPLDAEFQANTFTSGNQRRPAVASDADGDFVVVWESFGQDGSGYGVFGQRFNASGVAQGLSFRANSYVAGDQRSPSVASDANGNFIVAWHNDGPDGSSFGVFGQSFSAAGVPQAPEFLVNSYTTSAQVSPALASAANGNFVAVWSSLGQDGSGAGVFGQRFGDLIFRDGFDPTAP